MAWLSDEDRLINELQTGYADLEAKIKQLKEKIRRIKQLCKHYKSIGFNDTAKKIEKALE